MIRTFKIALRNLLRNRRRSAMTGSAIGVGALALLVFSSFVTYVFAGLQTNLVQRIGHLTVFRSGYFLFGAGNPAAYGIDDYQKLMQLIAADASLAPLINVITPTQSLVGIAGNFANGNDAAKTFLGVGVIPSDRDKMRQWNEFGVARAAPPDDRLADSDPTRGLVGGGLARILGLCAPLKLPNCAVAPAQRPTAIASAAPDPALADLARRDLASGANTQTAEPEINLLAATAGGAPNVVDFRVGGVDPQGAKELDDNYVAMHFALAQQLVYGRGEHKATGIVLQLHRSEDLAKARAALNQLFRREHLDLEVRDYIELTPFYAQVVSLFGSIFLFMALIMGVIVLFAVVNTMTMNVMERTNEIGTIRAMGVRRGGVRRQFIAEGLALGAAGATLGAVLAVVVVIAVNSAGLTWWPPGQSSPTPLQLDLFGRPLLLAGTWLALTLIATVASLIPADRAAKMSVVNALRHV
jgi:putative ABC transport system permease protein